MDVSEYRIVSRVIGETLGEQIQGIFNGVMYVEDEEDVIADKEKADKDKPEKETLTGQVNKLYREIKQEQAKELEKFNEFKKKTYETYQPNIAKEKVAEEREKSKERAMKLEDEKIADMKLAIKAAKLDADSKKLEKKEEKIKKSGIQKTYDILRKNNDLMMFQMELPLAGDDDDELLELAKKYGKHKDLSELIKKKAKSIRKRGEHSKTLDYLKNQKEVKAKTDLEKAEGLVNYHDKVRMFNPAKYFTYDEVSKEVAGIPRNGNPYFNKKKRP